MHYLYNDWYVVRVFSNKESFIKGFIEKKASVPIPIMVFSREIIHKLKGKSKKWVQPLFPGYLFVQKEIDKVIEIVKTNIPSELFEPVCFDGKPRKVHEDEMKLLLFNADNAGVFRLSLGYREGNAVKIIKGPLKEIDGKIFWIDKRKKKAKVEISLFQRKIMINLGIDIVMAPQKNRIQDEAAMSMLPVSESV